LDTALGRPAKGVPITLSIAKDDGSWEDVAHGTTNDDGRVADLLKADQQLAPDTYRMTFDTETYFSASASNVFYPVVHVVFNINEDDQHYHIPLLLSPYGYLTYRGS